MDCAGNQLKVLNLHWNQIKFRGGLRLAEALSRNDVLKILDISWNLLGKWNLPFFGKMPVSEVKKKLKN